MATLSWPATAPKIIRQRSATCCGVPCADSHFSNCVRSAGSNLIAKLVFGMSEIIATVGNAVKLFKGHYTRFPPQCCVLGSINGHRFGNRKGPRGKRRTVPGLPIRDAELRKDRHCSRRMDMETWATIGGESKVQMEGSPCRVGSVSVMCRKQLLRLRQRVSRAA